MSFLDQIKSADARRTSSYFEAPGRYLVEIKDIVEGKNRKGRGFIAVETSVIDAEVCTGTQKGELKTWMQMTDTDVAARNIRSMLCGVLDVPDSALSDEMIDRAFHKNEETGRSHMSGIKAVVLVRTIQTRAGKDFSLCDFSSAPEDARDLEDC